MAKTALQGNPVSLSGDLPAVGSQAPDFQLVAKDLGDKTLADFAGKKKLLNIVPSLDTGVCAASTKKFNELAKFGMCICLDDTATDIEDGLR